MNFNQKTSKKEFVEDVFNNVASKYDIMNDVMSFGIHRLWKDAFALKLDNPNAKLLDIAGGSGDISQRFYKYCKENNVDNPQITLTDINPNMLKTGIENLTNKGILGINYVCCDAENLPFENNYFDYYTVAFGIRNFSNISKSLSEAKRILKKGGKFLCLEFSKIQNPFLSSLYNSYSNFCIPKMGSLIAGNSEPYEYLVDSIKKFPSQDSFAEMIKDAGFSSVSYKNLSGGIVAIHTAYKI